MKLQLSTSVGHRAGSVGAPRLKARFAALLLSTFLIGPLQVALPAQTAAEPQPELKPANQIAVNVSITPKRLTFQKGERAATVYIFNQGRVPATFDISIGDSVMLPTGDILPLNEALLRPDAKPFVDKLASGKAILLATPRRATLAPGKGQTIRIRITPPANATSAEYRSHLTVRTVPPRDTGITAESVGKVAPNQLSFQITPIFGLSIPVIVRNGEADVRGDIQNTQLTYAQISSDGVTAARRTPVLAFDMARTGKHSLFGNVEIRAKGKDKEPIGVIRGLGVYGEIDHRLVKIPLKREPVRGEQLEVSFIDDDISPGRVITKAIFTVP